MMPMSGTCRSRHRGIVSASRSSMQLPEARVVLREIVDVRRRRAAAAGTPARVLQSRSVGQPALKVKSTEA